MWTASEESCELVNCISPDPDWNKQEARGKSKLGAPLWCFFSLFENVRECPQWPSSQWHPHAEWMRG